MTTVTSKLNIIVAEKELRDGRRYSNVEIAAASGANISTVQRLMRNTIKRVPLDELALICKWVPCQPGDILKME